MFLKKIQCLFAGHPRPSDRDMRRATSRTALHETRKLDCTHCGTPIEFVKLDGMYPAAFRHYDPKAFGD